MRKTALPSERSGATGVRAPLENYEYTGEGATGDLREHWQHVHNIPHVPVFKYERTSADFSGHGRNPAPIFENTLIQHFPRQQRRGVTALRL